MTIAIDDTLYIASHKEKKQPPKSKKQKTTQTTEPMPPLPSIQDTIIAEPTDPAISPPSITAPADMDTSPIKADTDNLFAATFADAVTQADKVRSFDGQMATFHSFFSLQLSVGESRELFVILFWFMVLIFILWKRS